MMRLRLIKFLITIALGCFVVYVLIPTLRSIISQENEIIRLADLPSGIQVIKPDHQLKISAKDISIANEVTSDRYSEKVMEKSVTLPKYLGCQDQGSGVYIDYQFTDTKKMTIKLCQNVCLEKASYYAILHNGSSCYCLPIGGQNYLQKNNLCNTPCTGDPIQTCGGEKVWQVYQIDNPDGDTSWTPWTQLGRKDFKGALRTRYRSCERSLTTETTCTAELGSSMLKGKPTTILETYFIGCFSSKSFQQQNLTFIISTRPITSATDAIKSSMDCLLFCQASSAVYAVHMMDQCLCTSSLGWSLPADVCVYDEGALVMSTHPIQKQQILLKFEAPRTTHRIGVVAHYRGGSTFSSLMISSFPGTLYVFEPCSVFGAIWPDVNMSFALESERNGEFLEKIYSSYFHCQVYSLPGIFLRRWPEWGEGNQGLEPYKNCKKKYPNFWGPIKCMPYVKEACFMAPIIAAKTTRIINVDTISLFAKDYPHIHLLHSMRDPRGTVNSRAKMEAYFRVNTDKHIRTNCWELNQLRSLFEAPKAPSNLHVVHYEDLARDAISTAQHLYSELKLPMQQEVIDALNRATGKTNATRRSVYDTVQAHPEQRIEGWTKTLNSRIVANAEADPECRTFFSFYNDYYKPLKEMKTGK